LTFPDRGARWPASDDDAGSVKLQQGFLERQASFTPGRWLQVGR